MSNPVNGYNFHPEEQNTIAPPSPREDYPQSSNRGCRERLSRPPIKQFPCTATRSLISYYLYILKLAEIRVRSSRTRFRFREGLILSLFFFFFHVLARIIFTTDYTFTRQHQSGAPPLLRDRVPFVASRFHSHVFFIQLCIRKWPFVPFCTFNYFCGSFQNWKSVFGNLCWYVVHCWSRLSA